MGMELICDIKKTRFTGTKNVLKKMEIYKNITIKREMILNNHLSSQILHYYLISQEVSIFWHTLILSQLN